MRLSPLPIDGAYAIDLERIEDERGFFARTLDVAELAAAGLAASFPQQSVSFTNHRGTIRGLHYQSAPHEECKLVRCTRGRIFDVMVDLRPSSPTYLRWHALELDDSSHRAAYVPAGCAHGLQTLVDATEVLYLISRPYHPSSAAGVRWDDPLISVQWPITPPLVSARDDRWPPLLEIRA